MNYRIKLILIFIIGYVVNQYSQQGIADSLEKQLDNLQGEKKVEVLDRLADIYQYINTNNAIEYANKGVELAKSFGDDKGLASCYGSLGFCYISLYLYRFSELERGCLIRLDIDRLQTLS